jgi:deoxycytidine triphosphate deaminase
MERKDILKAIVLLGTLIMVGSMFAPSLMFGPTDNGQVSNEDEITGVAQFTGMIRTYEPVLDVTQPMDEALLSKLRTDERVKLITSYSGGYIINTTTRDDVYSLSQYLRENDVVSKSIANIILPPVVELELSNGSKTEVISVGSIRIVSEPLVDTDTDVLVQMIATAKGGRLITPISGKILSKSVDATGIAKISSFEGIHYEFVIPWEERDKVDESAYSQATYTRADYISFPGGLNVLQITQMKDLEYITFISDTGASVNENFTDRNQIKNDFGNISILFPDSNLLIDTNEEISLPYNGSLSYKYIVSLPASVEEYIIDSKNITLKSETKFSLNESINITVRGVAMGDKIVKIDEIIAG